MTGMEAYNVLFLCTGNSARSILAESLLNTLGHGKFRAFSAGSFPKGQVHPMAVELLKRMNLPAEKVRSKSWDEFAAPGAPSIDLIFTVCDNAAGEVCPIWPGKPLTAHWGNRRRAIGEHGGNGRRLATLIESTACFIMTALDDSNTILRLSMNACLLLRAHR